MTNKLIFPDIHIYIYELACPCCGKLPPDLYTDGHYYSFFQKWEKLRTEWNDAIPISEGGGWRCTKYQYSLVIRQKTNAVLSPHYFWALDNDLNTKQEVLNFVDLVDLHFPEFRVGYIGYLDRGQTFVHIDEAYLIKPKPAESWVRGLRF